MRSNQPGIGTLTQNSLALYAPHVRPAAGARSSPSRVIRFAQPGEDQSRNGHPPAARRQLAARPGSPATRGADPGRASRAGPRSPQRQGDDRSLERSGRYFKGPVTSLEACNPVSMNPARPYARRLPAPGMIYNNPRRATRSMDGPVHTPAEFRRGRRPSSSAPRRNARKSFRPRVSINPSPSADHHPALHVRQGPAVLPRSRVSSLRCRRSGPHLRPGHRQPTVGFRFAQHRPRNAAAAVRAEARPAGDRPRVVAVARLQAAADRSSSVLPAAMAAAVTVVATAVQSLSFLAGRDCGLASARRVCIVGKNSPYGPRSHPRFSYPAWRHHADRRRPVSPAPPTCNFPTKAGARSAASRRGCAMRDIAAVYASPLDRTMETARILAEPHNLEREAEGRTARNFARALGGDDPQGSRGEVSRRKRRNGTTILSPSRRPAARAGST